jgi:hypothetical protein
VAVVHTARRGCPLTNCFAVSGRTSDPPALPFSMDPPFQTDAILASPAVQRGEGRLVQAGHTGALEHSFHSLSCALLLTHHDLPLQHSCTCGSAPAAPATAPASPPRPATAGKRATVPHQSACSAKASATCGAAARGCCLAWVTAAATSRDGGAARGPGIRTETHNERMGACARAHCTCAPICLRGECNLSKHAAGP